MRFFTVEVRIVGSLPSSNALRGQAFPAQQAANPLIGNRRKQTALSAIFGQFGHRPIGEGQASILGIGQGHVHQLAQLFGPQNRWPPPGITDLLEAGEPALVEAMNPIVNHGEVATDPIRRIQQRVAALHLIDNPVALMDAGGEGKIMNLFPQRPCFAAGQRTQGQLFRHTGPPAGPVYHLLG